MGSGCSTQKYEVDVNSSAYENDTRSVSLNSSNYGNGQIVQAKSNLTVSKASAVVVATTVPDGADDSIERLFVEKLKSGEVRTGGDKTGFHARRSASAQKIVEDPGNKEVFNKQRTTVYASTEMGIIQEFKAPFSPHVLGTFSCHGIAPAEDEEPDDLMQLLGQTGNSPAKKSVYQKTNQDRGCVVYPYNSNSRQALLLVLDGHGDQGDRVAEYAMNNLVLNLESALLTMEPEEALRAAFKLTDTALKKETSIKAMSSGTTVVAAYVKDSKIYFANVGDSRGVIAFSNGGNAQECDESTGSMVATRGNLPYVRPGSDIVGSTPMMSPAMSPNRDMLSSNPDMPAKPNGIVTSHSTRIVQTVTSTVQLRPRCEPCTAYMCTVDHKPDDPVELARIKKSRGHVSVPTKAAGIASYQAPGGTLRAPNVASSGAAAVLPQFDTVQSPPIMGGGPSSPFQMQSIDFGLSHSSTSELAPLGGSISASASVGSPSPGISIGGTAAAYASGVALSTVPSARVWLDPQHTLVGLAMSRSIGDFAVKTVGVISTPDIYVHEMCALDRFMILASDGVWEFMDNQEAVDVVQRNLHLGAFTACQILIQTAEKRWKLQEGDYRDDITAVVIVFPFWPNDAPEIAVATSAQKIAESSI